MFIKRLYEIRKRSYQPLVSLAATNERLSVAAQGHYRPAKKVNKNGCQNGHCLKSINYLIF